MRTPDTFQDAVTNEGLQDRLKMPWGEPVLGRERLRGNRASPCIDGNVNYGSNGEEALNGIWGARPTVAPDTSGIRLRPAMRLAANGGVC